MNVIGFHKLALIGITVQAAEQANDTMSKYS